MSDSIEDEELSLLFYRSRVTLGRIVLVKVKFNFVFFKEFLQQWNFRWFYSFSYFGRNSNFYLLFFKWWTSLLLFRWRSLYLTTLLLLFFMILNFFRPRIEKYSLNPRFMSTMIFLFFIGILIRRFLFTRTTIPYHSLIELRFRITLIKIELFFYSTFIDWIILFLCLFLKLLLSKSFTTI